MSEASSTPDPAVVRIGGKFLTFFLDEEEFGIEILKVSEIMGLLPITAIPGTPASVLGVVDLRGKVVPILDLRLRLGMPALDPTEETCIIVTQLDGLNVGLVVDRVSEVLDIRDEDVDEAPSLGREVETQHLLGIARWEGTVKLLLDIEAVLPAAEVHAMADALKEEAA